MATALDTAPDQVRATAQFTVNTGEMPVSVVQEPGHGSDRRSGSYEEREIVIRNARPIADRLDLDREGFVLRRHPTAVQDFYDDAEVRRIYYPEMERLVMQATGAARVLVFDHTIRVDDAGRADALKVRAPVRNMHNDFTRNSAPQRVRDLLPPAAAEQALRRRFAIINVWRSINGPVTDTPLAFTDARTVADEDWIATDLVYPDRTGEIYRVAFNPAHRWFYVPNLQPDELLLLKTFDSASDGRARYMPHSAFDDPATKPGTAKRQSIESRVLAFF